MKFSINSSEELIFDRAATTTGVATGIFNTYKESIMNKVGLIIVSFFIFSANAFAQWELIGSDSVVNFVSIKKSRVGEIHHFSGLEGKIKTNGSVSFNIDLASVETNIPVRNDRMKSMLFEVVEFPKANLSGKIDLTYLSNLKVGESYQDSIEFGLSLHGISQQILSDLTIIKLTDNQVMITSTKPIIIDTEDYKLSEGVEMLRSVAKLSSISTAVPVTFSLVFKK